MLLFKILAYIIHGKIQKSYTKTINLKYHLELGRKNLIHVIVHVLYWIFKAIFSISSRNTRQTDNPPIRIYVNKIGNRITFRIKTG